MPSTACQASPGRLCEISLLEQADRGAALRQTRLEACDPSMMWSSSRPRNRVFKPTKGAFGKSLDQLCGAAGMEPLKPVHGCWCSDLLPPVPDQGMTGVSIATAWRRSWTQASVSASSKADRTPARWSNQVQAQSFGPGHLSDSALSFTHADRVVSSDVGCFISRRRLAVPIRPLAWAIPPIGRSNGRRGPVKTRHSVVSTFDQTNAAGVFTISHGTRNRRLARRTCESRLPHSDNAR
jgi:hypothetical protein